MPLQSADAAMLKEKLGQSKAINPPLQLKKPKLAFTPAMKPPILNKPLKAPIIKPIIKPVEEKPADEIVEQVKAEKVEEVAAEAEVKAETTTEVKTETETEEAVDTTEEKKPGKKHRRRRRTKQEMAEAATKQEDAVVDGEPVKVEPLVVPSEDHPVKFVYTVPKTELSLQDAIKDLNVGYIDEDWEAEKANVITQISEVVISDDMNQAAISVALTQLSHIRDEIWLSFNNSRTVVMNLSRPGRDNEGFIDRIRALNAVGSNDIERRKNGIMAVMNYKNSEGLNINMYEVLDVMTIKYYFYRDAMNQIQFKVDCLKGLSYGLGVDAKLTPYTEG